MYNLLSVLFWQAISSYLIQTIYFHRFSCYRRYFYDYPYKNIKIFINSYYNIYDFYSLESMVPWHVANSIYLYKYVFNFKWKISIIISEL